MKLNFDFEKYEKEQSKEQSLEETVVKDKETKEEKTKEKSEKKPKKEKKKKESTREEKDTKAKIKDLSKLQIILGVVFALTIALVGFFTFKLFSFRKEYKEGEKIYEGALEYVTENEGYEYTADVVTGPYNIDFVSLQAENADICAWIVIPDTVVNYPVLYSHDNKDYLRTTYTGEKNICGSIFMDCENISDFSSANTILYGHNMHNGTMFRVLNDYSNEDYYKEHPYVWICTPTKQTKYNIIATYRTTAAGDTYNKDFIIGSSQYKEWLSSLVEKSYYKCADYDEQKPTITLSTCVYHNSDKRMIVLLQESEESILLNNY